MNRVSRLGADAPFRATLSSEGDTELSASLHLLPDNMQRCSQPPCREIWMFCKVYLRAPFRGAFVQYAHRKAKVNAPSGLS
jgi:hypothetical protein